jgi:membrane-associated protease RseP (regulator of RpoE activity)
MAFWLILLLGLVTYFMVQRSVAGLTRTPVWILWLVLMTPVLIWLAWTTKHGSHQPLPNALLIWPFVICFVLYWLLIQWGRKGSNLPAAQTQRQAPESKSEEGATPPSVLRPLDQSEETRLRNCFPWSAYYIHNIEYRPQAVICRGQLRTTPAVAYQKIWGNIEAEFGDRFLVIFQEGLNGKPFFALVPNPQSQTAGKRSTERLTRPLLALGLLAATLLTTTVVGSDLAGVNMAALKSNPGVLLNGLAYAVALMTILGIHELGHYLAARLYKIRSTLPYFIPVPFFLGTFGAFIQMRSPVPNRKALFDVSIAGPLAGFVVTLPVLMWGLTHSTVVPLSTKAGMLNPEALNPNYSLLLALLSKLALGSALTATKAIDLHPVALAGFLGLVVTALNLMPVGQLDGGHIVHAMFGLRAAVAIGQIARLLLLGLSLIQPGLLIWAIILFLMPISDQPALNDVTELDNKRDLWGLLALALLVIIILPAPKLITDLLQI